MPNKRIGITQKLIPHSEYKEVNLSLDIQWINFFATIDAFPIPLPLVKQNQVKKLIETLDLHGIILSGGGDLFDYSEGNLEQKKLSKCRDDFEFKIISSCISLDIPILGICRGLQLINKYFSGSLEKVDNHVSTTHTIRRVDSGEIDPKNERIVNSYHNWGITCKSIGKNLTPLEVDNKGNVEYLKHNYYDIFGIMWHPERQLPFSKEDKNLIKKHMRLI
jgi:putative glutamine amidotransferase